MEKLLKSIEISLENKNWYSALVVSLIIPDICGKIENNGEYSSERYPKWFDKYLGKKYEGYFSGKDCYAFRCSFLHEGSTKIPEESKSKEVLDCFVFTSKSNSHLTRLSNCYSGEVNYDGKEVLQLSVFKFCKDIIEATRKWIKENESKNKLDILEIKEEFSMGGIKFL